MIIDTLILYCHNNHSHNLQLYVFLVDVLLEFQSLVLYSHNGYSHNLFLNVFFPVYALLGFPYLILYIHNNYSHNLFLHVFFQLMFYYFSNPWYFLITFQYLALKTLTIISSYDDDISKVVLVLLRINGKIIIHPTQNYLQ